MKSVLHLIFAASMILSAGPMSHAADEAPSFIKNLSGCFGVTFRYIEDGLHNKEIKDNFESITLVTEGKTYKLQHLLIVDHQSQKHWREEWTELQDGRWSQKVVGPFEDFRYECAAPLQFNQWRCTSLKSPKPRRDRARTEYETLDRENTLQITDRGWVQNENNIKRSKDGKAVSNELGWNEYRRVEDSKCQGAE